MKHYLITVTNNNSVHTFTAYAHPKTANEWREDGIEVIETLPKWMRIFKRMVR